MRLINKLRFKYSIIFLVVGLALGYFLNTYDFKSVTTSSIQEIEEKPIEKVPEKIETPKSQPLGFATITSSIEEKNDLITLGFENLPVLDGRFYEGWIVEFSNDKSIAKISTGKFNINKDGYIIDTDKEIINDKDSYTAIFSQVGSDDEIDWPVNLLDMDKDYRIFITIENDEDISDLTQSDQVVLSGEVENKIVALKPPRK